MLWMKFSIPYPEILPLYWGLYLKKKGLSLGCSNEKLHLPLNLNIDTYPTRRRDSLWTQIILKNHLNLYNPNAIFVFHDCNYMTLSLHLSLALGQVYSKWQQGHWNDVCEHNFSMLHTSPRILWLNSTNVNISDN